MTFSDVLTVISPSSLIHLLLFLFLLFHYIFHFSSLLLGYSSLFCFSHSQPYSFLVSIVTPDYELKSKDFELEINNQKEWRRSCNVIIIQSQKDSQKQIKLSCTVKSFILKFCSRKFHYAFLF